MAQPFYDHLRQWNAVWLDSEMIAANLRVVEPGTNPATFSPYPWSVTATDDANKAIASLGQLKAVFSLRLETVPAFDTDNDGMPDAWEMLHGLNPEIANSASDHDMDGLSNIQEYLASTNPRDPDTDDDLLPDGWEITHGFNPLVKNPDAMTADPDGDGFSNFMESVYGTNPFDATSVPTGTPDVEIILPPPPIDPPDQEDPPVVTDTGWHFEVAPSRKHLPKYGFDEFDGHKSVPPKRYLEKIETVDFSLHGDEGEDAESEINGVRITTVDPVTGIQTVNDFQHYGNNNMGGSVEPESATLAIGVEEVTGYHDEPNRKSDRDATKSLRHLLEEVNTKEMLVSNVIAELPNYPAEYVQGSPQAHRNLYDDELGFDYQKVKYRVVWNDGVAEEDRHAVKWLLVFKPEDDPETPENESETDTEIVKVLEWNGTGGESSDYEINPESERAGKDGRYFLMPITLTVVYGVGPADSDSRQLLEDYLESEPVKISRFQNIWMVKGKNAAGVETPKVLEIADNETALLRALSTLEHTVVFDGHSNFGIGPNFAKGTHKTIPSFTNFGSNFTDIPRSFHGDGTEQDVAEFDGGDIPPGQENALNRFQLQGFSYIVPSTSEIPSNVLNEIVPILNIQRFPNTDGVPSGGQFQIQGGGLNRWHFNGIPGVDEGSDAFRCVVAAPDSDIPVLRYKTYFYNSCSTGPDYIGKFQQGEFVYTNVTCAIQGATAAFVEKYLSELETGLIVQKLNLEDFGQARDDEVEVYSLKDFTK